MLLAIINCIIICEVSYWIFAERTFSQLQSSQNNHVTQSQLLHGNIPSDSQRYNADFQTEKLSQQAELTQHATLMQRPYNQSSQRNALPSSQTRSPKIGIVAPAQHAQSQQYALVYYSYVVVFCYILIIDI